MAQHKLRCSVYKEDETNGRNPQAAFRRPSHLTNHHKKISLSTILMLHRQPLDLGRKPFCLNPVSDKLL
jgi:hypothetical protein